MSDVIDSIKAKYPQYANVPDDALVDAIGTKYPQYLKSSEDFGKEFSTVQAKYHTPIGSQPHPELSTTTGGPQLRIAGAPGTGAALGRQVATAFKEAQSASFLDEALPEAEVNKTDSKTMAVGKEAYNLIASVPKFATSGAGFETLPLAAAKPVLTAAAFTADMLKNLGRTIIQSHKDWDSYAPSEKAKAVTDIAGTAAFAGLLGHGVVKGLKGGESNASKVSKAAEVHGDVRAQPVGGEGKVPAQESGGGVQPPAEEQAQILLNKRPTSPSPFRIEQDEDGKYVVTNPGGGIEGNPHDTLQSAKEMVQALIAKPKNEAAAAARASEIKLTEDEAKAQGPEAVKAIMAKHGVNRDTAVAIQAASRERLGISRQASDMAGQGKPAAVTERNLDSSPAEVVGNLKHSDGIRYGLGLNKSDVPRLQEKYDSLGKEMQDAVQSQDEAKFKAAFGKLNFIGGALMGATRGEHPISGSNYERFLKDNPDAAPKPVEEVKLSPEDQSHLDAERGTVGVPVEVVDAAQGDNPFAKRLAGNIATIDRATGKILINKDEFSKWLKDIPADGKRLAVRSLLGEERIHLATDDAAADAFWKNLTAAERAIVQRRYSGGVKIPGMNNTLWGHEALRFRMQQLARMTPREIADAVGTEKWTVKGLTLIETAIRGIREKFLRTGASKESLAILGKIQENLNMGKVVAAGGGPAAMSKAAQKLAFKQADELEEDANLFEKHGDKAGADEMRDMAKNLREKTFDQSFQEPAARVKPKPPTREFQESVIEAWNKFSPFPKEGAEEFERATRTARELGWTPEDQDPWEDAVFNFASMPSERWPLNTRLKQQMLDYYAQNNGTEHDRMHLVEQAISAGEMIVQDEKANLDDWVNMEKFSKGAEKSPGVSDSINRERQLSENALQDALDSLGVARVELKKLKDSGYSDKNIQDQLDLNLPMARRKKINDEGQMKLDSLISSDKFQAMRAAISGTPAGNSILQKAQKEMFERAQAEAGQKNFPAARPKKKSESVFQGSFLLPNAASIGAKSVFDTKTGEVASAPALSTEGKELPPVAASERQTAEASGALPRLTSAQIDAKASESLSAAVQPRLEAARAGKRMSLPTFKEFAGKSKLQQGRLLEIWQNAVGKLLENMPGEDMRLLAKAGIQQKTLEILSDKDIESKFKGDQKKIDEAKAQRDRSLTGEGKSKRSIWDASVPDKDEGIDTIKKFTALERDLEQKVQEISDRQDELKEITSESKSSTELLQDRTEIDGRLADARTAVWDATKSSQDARRRVAELKPTYDAILQKRKRRGWIQSALFRKMVRPALEENEASLTRKEVTPEEVRVGGGDKFSAYEDTTRLPDSKVADALVDRARRSKEDPATVTRRLAVLLTPRTGTVHMVSAYHHRSYIKDGSGRTREVDEVRAVDPLSPMREHVALDRLMSRYKVLHSVLLDEPVRKFRQDFKSVADYNKKFGNDADRAEQSAKGYQPDSISEEEFMAESGGRISEGSGGSFQGPHRDLVFEGESGANEKSEVTPLTDAEGKALLDHVLSYGEPLSIDDVDAALSKLADVKNRQAMSAIAKLGRALQEKYPDSDGSQLKKMLAQFIFENYRANRKIGRGAPAAIKQLNNPMAINRNRLREERDRLVGELNIATTRAGDVFKRKDTVQAMAASLDAADTVANNFAENAEWSVRLASADEARSRILRLKENFYGKKDILESAPAMLAAGAVKARYHYSFEAQAEADRLLTEDEEFKKAAEFAGRNRDKKNPGLKLEGEVANKELQQRIQKRLLETGFLSSKDATYYHNEDAKNNLDMLMDRVKRGNEAADRMAKDGNAWDRFRASRWKKGNARLMRSLEYAKAQWENPELRETASMMRQELDKQFDMERENGYNVSYDPDYLPGRYDGELFSQHGVLFAGRRIMGRQFRSAKVFPTIFHAAEAGPYVPASLDGSALVASRVRQGMRSVTKRSWWDGLKNLKDDATGQPVAKEGKEVKGKISAPSPEYTHEFNLPGGKKIYVLDGYESLVHQLTDPSAVTNWAPTRAALEAGQMLKHTVLMGDIFHLGRVMYYGGSILGKRTAYLPGWAATSLREQDIPRAVKAGVISQKTADFLNEKVAFRIGARADMISRARLSHLYQRSGLNVGKIQDAIYKDLVKSVPGLGQYNRFLFDRFTRGMMTTAALREFDRLSKLDPQKDSRDIVQESAKDLNAYFGNIGRQGWIKSATFQDMARLVFLAPQWLEGLVRKEVSPLRGLHSPMRAFSGRDTMFRGMARGLLGMLVLTQVVNLINRRQPTWQNKEKDHKWDADVGDNVWLSPTAVFNELTGDMIRLSETKPKAWDAIQQIGENKLGFYGRLALVLATSKAPGGQYQTTTPGVLGQAAAQLLPTPISFGPLIKEGAHMVAPGMVSPVPSSTLRQKVFSTTGLKTHAGKDAVGYVKQSAEKFRAEHGITEPMIQYTDEPSYSQLRFLLKNGDERGAAMMLQKLKTTKTDRDIIDAMRLWVRRPFTGSLHSERLWLGGMSDEERQLYSDAVNQKMQDYQNFQDWFIRAEGQ